MAASVLSRYIVLKNSDYMCMDFVNVPIKTWYNSSTNIVNIDYLSSMWTKAARQVVSFLSRYGLEGRRTLETSHAPRSALRLLSSPRTDFIDSFDHKAYTDAVKENIRQSKFKEMLKSLGLTYESTFGQLIVKLAEWGADHKNINRLAIERGWVSPESVTVYSRQ